MKLFVNIFVYILLFFVLSKILYIFQVFLNTQPYVLCKKYFLFFVSFFFLFLVSVQMLRCWNFWNFFMNGLFYCYGRKLFYPKAKIINLFPTSRHAETKVLQLIVIFFRLLVSNQTKAISLFRQLISNWSGSLKTALV